MHGSDIEVVESCIHVGIALNAWHFAGACVEQAANRLRRTCTCSFLSMANCGIRISDIESIAAAKICKNVLMPRCMYGAELWHSFGNNQLHALEVANRFCLKHIQCLPRSPKSILVEGIIGACSYSAEHNIDEKKLLFVGRVRRPR